MCRDGHGVEKDERRAAKLFQLASDQGFAEGIANLALCYQEGRGVAKDEKRAIALFRQAADKGLARAQFNVGTCYQVRCVYSGGIAIVTNL
jgi:hypothetical protein